MTDISNYEGLYQINKDGEVVSLGNGNSTCPNYSNKRILKSKTKKNGYKEVKLFKNGKRKYMLVHRLVAQTFIPNPYNLPQVNHIDCNKTNNNVDNLEWCTPQQNIKHSVENKRQVYLKGKESPCSKQVLQLSLTGEIIKEWGSINEVKRVLGFNSFGIIKCCKKEKRYKTAYGYKWRYKPIQEDNCTKKNSSPA